MNSTETRNASLKQLYMDDKISPMQQKVLEALYSADLTDNEIMAETGLNINVVTGRRNELVDMGLVMNRDKRFNEATNAWNTVWGIRSSFDLPKEDKTLPFTFMRRLEQMIYKLKAEGNDRQVQVIREILG